VAKVALPAWASTGVLLLLTALVALLSWWWSASKRRSQERSPWPAHKSATRLGGEGRDIDEDKVLCCCDDALSLVTKKCAWTCNQHKKCL
jgi:hypothetical protein